MHFNVTRNPNALWVYTAIAEAWAYQQPHRFLLLDRDAKFGAEVLSAVRDVGSEPTRRGLSQSVAEQVLRSAGWEVADAICWTM